MAVKIALESFLAVLKRSNLLTAAQLQSLLDTYQRESGRTNDSRHFAEFLVAQKALTPWQAEKLLQGKHKGFFLGKYRLLSLVGKGGMSSVYLAEHVLMRRRCAIKVLPTRRLQNPSYLARFHREAQAVAALDHRNIVRAYDVDHEMDGEIDIHFLVMEFVDGKGLLDLVVHAPEARLPPVVAAEYIRQAALGLQHAHTAGLVHRDVKPGNLLVDTQGTVKVLDLGLARFYESSEETSLTVQHDERVLGTADYLAPEQAVDSHRVDARADIYGLGCTLYLCLTGQPPFTQGTLAQRLMAHQTREPPTVESIQPEIPTSLGVIVRKMMAKDPGARYQSASDVAAALEAWLKTMPKTDLDRSFAGLDRQTPTPSERPPEPVPAARRDTVHAGSRAKPAATPQVEPRRKPASPPTRAPAAAAAAPAKRKPIEPRGQTGASVPLHQVDEETTIGSPPVPPGVNVPPLFAEVDGVPEPEAQEVVFTESSSPEPQSPVPGQAEPEFSAFESEVLIETAGLDTATPQEFVFDDDVVVRRPSRKSAVAAPWEGLLQMARTKLDSSQQQFQVHWRRVRTKLFEKVRSASKKSNIQEIDGLRKRRKQSGIVWMIAAVGGVVVVGLLIWAMLPKKSDGIGGGDGGSGKGQRQTATTPQPKVPDNLGPILSVGDKEPLKTIEQAIEYVRKHGNKFTGKPSWTIKVEGGDVLKQAIHVARSDGSKFPEHVLIESVGASPAVLKPDGSGPVIEIGGIEHLTVRGFMIDAAGRSVAARIEGGFPSGTKLEKLQFRSVEQTGLLCSHVNGYKDQLLLTELQFQGTSSNAIAMQFQTVGKVQVTGCRFVGPLGAGIDFAYEELKSNTEVKIAKCLFHEMQVGVRFSGKKQDLQQITLLNNTFYRLEQGLVWDDMPSEGSAGLTVSRNLFVGVTKFEATVTAGFDRVRWEALLPADRDLNNWTDRPELVTSPEATSINLFAQGKRGQTQSFASTDPANPGFLKPTAPSVAIEVKSGEQGADPFVGAIAP